MVQPVSSLGGYARPVARTSLPSPRETEETAAERIGGPPILTRSRALSFAHTSPFRCFLFIGGIALGRSCVVLGLFREAVQDLACRSWISGR